MVKIILALVMVFVTGEAWADTISYDADGFVTGYSIGPMSCTEGDESCMNVPGGSLENFQAVYSRWKVEQLMQVLESPSFCLQMFPRRIGWRYIVRMGNVSNPVLQHYD